MTNQVTVIRERARESLIAKGMLGEKLCYYEAIQLCYNGYNVCIVPGNDPAIMFFLKVRMVKDNPVIFQHTPDGWCFEYFPKSSHLFEDWIVKN